MGKYYKGCSIKKYIAGAKEILYWRMSIDMVYWIFQKLEMIVLIQKRLIVSILAAMFVLSGCDQGKVDQTDYYKGKSAKELYSMAQKSEKLGNNKEALKIYTALESHYPESSLTKQGMLNSINLNYKQGEVEGTIAAVDHFTRIYPIGDHAAYGYYMKGLVLIKEHGSWLQRKLKIPAKNYDTESLKEAFLSFKYVVKHFPKSKYVSNSIRLMSNIKTSLANHELDTAKFYLKQASYIAAVNRAREAIAIDSSKEIAEASYDVMLSSYQALKDTRMIAEVKKAKLLLKQSKKS